MHVSLVYHKVLFFVDQESYHLMFPTFAELGPIRNHRMHILKYVILVRRCERLPVRCLPKECIHISVTIPMFFWGKGFEGGRQLQNLTLLDITPTIADLMGLPMVREWEGKSVLR